MLQKGMVAADLMRMLDASLSRPRDAIVIHLLALGICPNEIMGWSKCHGVRIEDWDRETGALTIHGRHRVIEMTVAGTRLDTLLRIYVPSLQKREGKLFEGGVNLPAQIVKRIAKKAKIPSPNKVRPMMLVHTARECMVAEGKRYVNKLVTSYSSP